MSRNSAGSGCARGRVTPGSSPNKIDCARQTKESLSRVEKVECGEKTHRLNYRVGIPWAWLVAQAVV